MFSAIYFNSCLSTSFKQGSHCGSTCRPAKGRASLHRGLRGAWRGAPSLLRNCTSTVCLLLRGQKGKKAGRGICEAPQQRGAAGSPRPFGVARSPFPIPLDGSDRCAKWSTPNGAAACPVVSAGKGRWGEMEAMGNVLPSAHAALPYLEKLGSLSCLAWHRALDAICHWQEGALPLSEHREANLLLSVLRHRSLLLTGLVSLCAA